MRSGGCTLQQSLTTEAASVVKQAVTLAKRRGHAQVTPLHVANTMLVSSTGLLRTACLQSHSHPLQCKALELCFNVALNRLPTSSSSPMLGGPPHSQQHPSISNALVAAFKRAQAHQRRGSIENQQQPLLAVKIELEQLIISILDDPSVSRVMREAGFSSTQVKSNVEQAVSLELCSQTGNNNKSKDVNSLLVLTTSHDSPPPDPALSHQIGSEKEVGNNRARAGSDHQVVVNNNIRNNNEDVMRVIENMVNKRRTSIVIVGESHVSIEGVVKGVMDKVEKGDVPEALRQVKFVSLPPSYMHLSREKVEQKLGELKCLIKSPMSKGVVLYLGDLKWATDYYYRATTNYDQGRSYYCPVEHMIMELGRLVCGVVGEGGSCRLWLMGLATFQTYMRCRTGHPSLETIWGLHPLTIPAGGLGLSLIPDSDIQSESRSKKAAAGSSFSWFMLEGKEEDQQLTCCAECSAKFEIDARSLQSSTCNSEATTSSLPSWLQQYRDENTRLSSNDQDSVPVRELFKKWNSFCTSVHKQPHSSERTITFSSLSPSSSTSGFSHDQYQYPNLHQGGSVFEPKHSWRDHHFWSSTTSEAANKSLEPSLRMYIPEHKEYSKQAFWSNPNSTPNSASSSDVMETEYVQRFKELSSENLKTLCTALERKVPWQKDIVPEIASTILQCRSGMVRRKGKVRSTSEVKEETWLFFQGVDADAKEKIARELARLVFGSHSSFVSIALSSFSSTRADSTEDLRNKRSRDEQSCSYLERFAEAVSTNPHRVFLVEDVEQADYCSQMRIKRAIERGRITKSNGEEVILSDGIIILSCESFSSRSRACSPPIKQRSDGCEEDKGGGGLEETSPCVSLDLNISFDDDDDNAEDQSIDDIGLLESVDRQIIFRIQEL
ncbi:protein SMAX1-LIKE 3 [Cornus florida]|uniref:protein SMAX1-LIKE 3 n=1 Tax=Cornus florida TaxID=4283 RepID=UPI0028A1A897|nr:protein SMAX1-LIKE 3 [Cornus florida]